MYPTWIERVLTGKDADYAGTPILVLAIRERVTILSVLVLTHSSLFRLNILAEKITLTVTESPYRTTAEIISRTCG